MDAEAKTITGLNFEPGSIIAHRYEICERLGAGGVGMVYRAIDRDLDEVIALKLLLPHLAQDENVYRRFRNEVLVARSLSHPNIVRTHDMGRAEGGYSYISMEYVNGVSLKDKLVTKSPTGELLPVLGFEEALSILYQVISGVAYAHGKGVIHRDLKPANVMISKAGEVKLADFGTARIMGMDTTLTQTGQVIGTPDYMSPEQIRGEQLDPSCDIYALGIMAFELVTGQRPFTAESSVAVAFKHLNDPLPSFSAPGRSVPLWFEEVVRKAAAKKKSDRFASVMEFAAALLDYAPQLSVQSTFFSVDRTLLRTTGTQSVPASGTSSLPAQSTVPPVTTPNAGSGEFRFELGSAGAAPEDEGWRLGTSQQMSAEGLPLASGYREKPKDKSPLLKMLGFSFALFVGVFVIVALGARLFPSEQRSLAPSLSSLRESHPAAANFLSAWLGVELSRTSKPPRDLSARSSAMSSLSEEDRLRAELEGSSVSSSEPLKVASSARSEVLSSSSSSTSAPAEVLAKDTARDAKTSSEEQSSASSSEAPPKEVPSVVPLHFTGALALRDGSRNIADGSLSLDKLGQIRWSAALAVSGNAPLTGESAKNEFAVNVFDLRKSSVIVKLKPEEVQLPTASEPSLRLSGTLRSLGSAHPGAGSFRMDLIRAGEVISSSDLILYKASVSLAPDQGQTEQPIRIVTSSTLSENHPVTPSPELTPDSNRTPVVPPTLSDRVAEVPPLSNGLPLAKGHEGSQVLQPGVRDGVAPPPVSELPSEAPVNQAPVVNENYGGWIKIAPTEGAPEEQRAMILNLQFDGVAISGNATIAGYDAFNVSGKVFARGMELELRNGAYWIRLTSGPRERVLRGLYSFPALQRGKGKWEVSRSN